MQDVYSFLNSDLAVNWIAPIICGVLVYAITELIKKPKTGDRTSGNNPQAGQNDNQDLFFARIRKIIMRGKIPAAAIGVLVFFIAQALFRSGNHDGEQSEEQPVSYTDADDTIASEITGPEMLKAEKEEMEHWLDGDGTEFYGKREDGKIEGAGRAVYANGTAYEGEFKGGLRDGKGMLFSSSGDVIYDGEWKDNVKEGKGTEYFPESNGRYEGEFKAGKKEGNGIYYWENGDRYEGKWENDIRNGMGVLIREDGTTSAQIWLKDEFVTNFIRDAETWAGTDGTMYTGKKENDEIEGYGRVVYRNGDIYLGELKSGNKEGEGICYYKSGDRYEGEWKNGEKNGIGVYYFKSVGSVYCGEFLNGKLDGTGTYYVPSGFRYEGEFKEGNYFGEGTAWYSPDDESGRWYFEGEWTEDSYNGTLYYKDGTCETGIFRDDELVEVTGEMKGIRDQSEAVTWTEEDGTQYTGRKENGMLEGKGIRISKNGVMYIGEFIGGVPNGNGTEYYSDGDYYVGEFADGNRNGRGAYYYNDGGESKDWYCGEWIDGRRNGQDGTGYFYDGLRSYIGGYVEGKLNGMGSMYYTDGVYYGEWQDGIRTGTGVFSGLDGSCYFGEYKDNQKSGYGIMYYIDGSRYEGEWAEDKKNGTGTEYNPDGSKKHYGTWVDDIYQN